ncbi:MAG: outer membrane protein assembly factor BamA [Rhodobacteraceae bacterium]|nr:outer membrane protein assembly factor BamA [Paracoccaceae bacterium]
MAMGGVSTVPFTASPAIAQSFTFSSVAVRGNQRIPDASVREILGVTPGREITAAALNDGFQRLRTSGLFEEAEITPSGNVLIVNVREFPIINRISIEGNRRIQDSALLELIESTPRRVFNPDQALADAAAMAERYRAQGRFAATVSPKIIRRSDNRVDLVFEVLEGRVTENERISFVGNDSFSDRRLRRVLATKQAGLLRAFITRDSFNADRIELDRILLRDFYLSRGFIDVEVLAGVAELTRERDAFLLTFTVREGQSYRIGESRVVSDLPDVDVAAFQQLLRTRPGTTYSPVLVQSEISRLEELASRQGLSFVRAEPRIRRDNANRILDIDYALVRGPRIFVERIDIEGNATTLDRVIRSQFNTVEGDPFNPREISEAAERIRALGFFSEVDIDTRPGSAPDRLIVDVGVEEQPTGSLSFGVSYSVSQGVGLALSFSEDNFLGRGQSLSGTLTTGVQFRNVELSFREPRLLGRDLGAGMSVFLRTTERQNENFDRSSIGFTPAIDFPVNRNTRLALRYRLSEDRLLNVTSASAALVPGLEPRTGLTSALGYTLTFDTRRRGFDPNMGTVLRFSQDLAGLGGDVNYLRSTALAGVERRVFNEEVTLRAEVEGGVMVPLGGQSSRITDRFFMNSGEMRGFQRNGLGPRDLVAGDALGGNYFAVARFEAEFPLGLPEEYGISGGLFFDVGSVWGLNNTLGGAIDDSLRWRSTIGFSVFWDTPIGPLRLNFSRPVRAETYDRTQNFDLTISTRF